VVGFEGPGGTYRLHIDPGPPHGLEVATPKFRETWSIERAETRSSLLRLSGMAWPAEGVIDATAWFVLTLGEDPSIEYWGDRMLLRRDGA